MFSCGKALFERVRTALRLQETYIEPATFFMLNPARKSHFALFYGQYVQVFFPDLRVS